MSKTAALITLAFTQVAVLSLWFTTAAAAPDLAPEVDLSGARLGLLVSAVQAGFVVGSIASAFLGLADRIDPEASRRFYAVAALVGATANALFIVTDPGSTGAIVLRGITGAAMAGVYPVGMRSRSAGPTRIAAFSSAFSSAPSPSARPRRISLLFSAAWTGG